MFLPRYFTVSCSAFCLLLASTVMAHAAGLDDRKELVQSNVTAQGHNGVRHQRESDADMPSMMGNTAPTDYRAERISVIGRRASFDGVTRNAVGGGLMQKQDTAKSVSAVSRDFIAKQSPSADPVQLISLLAGANVTSNDAGGLSGSHISLRGLDQSQMGFTLEGFPLNDIGNYATYTQEIADPENLRTIQLAQGSADLDSPHISATGGVVDMYMIDPKDKLGGAFDVSYGAYGYHRGFLRVDTGKIGDTNIKAYFSGSYAGENMYRSSAEQHKLHAEMKVVNDWGGGNRVSLAVVGNRLYNYLTKAPTMANWNEYGRGVRYSTDPNNTIYNSVYDSSAKDHGKSYYKLHQNPFTNVYLSGPSTFKLTDHITLTETPYFWFGSGNGGNAYYNDLSKLNYGGSSTGTIGGSLAGQTTGSRLLYNPSNATTWRPGVVTKVTVKTGVNRLMLGYWFEYSRQKQQASYTGVNDDGSPWNLYAHAPNVTLDNGATYQYRDFLTQTRVHAAFIGDTLSLLHHRLTIDAGLKYVIATRQGTNGLPGISTPRTTSKTYEEPLPTASIRYKLNNQHQFFISGATNFRMPQNNTLYDSGTYSSITGYGNRANLNQKPEVSISEEAGYRYTGKLMMGSATYFHYNFTNRLFTQCLDATCYNTTSLNAGGQETDGVDAEIGTRPIFYHLRPYVSFEYLNSRLTNNLRSGTDFLPTKGKIAPQAPKYQVAFNLDYDDGHLFGGYSVKYVAKQYSTFMNDEAIKPYVLMNMDIGYRFNDIGFLKAPNLRVDFSNITNHAYLGGVNSVGTNAQKTLGLHGGMISANAPSYYIAAPFSAIATFSGGF